MLHSEGKASKPYSRLEIQKEKDKLLKESMSLLREACQKFTKRTAVMGKADNGPTKFQNITEEKLIIMQQHCLIEQLHLRLKICEAKLENKDRELENKDRENKEYFRHTNESLMKYQSKRSSLLEPKTTSTQLIVNSPKVFERKRKQLSRSNKGKSLFGEHMKNSSRDMPCSKNIGSTRAPMINAPETSRRKKQMKNQQTTMDFRKRWEQTELPKRGNLKDFRTITKLIGTECLVTKSDLHNNACEVLEQEIESQPGNRRWKPKANTRQNKPLGAEKEDQDVERKNISLRLKQKTLGKHHYESADKSDDQIKYEDIHVEKASFNHPESAVENIVIKNQMTLNEHNFTFIKEKTTEVSSIDIKSMEYFSSKEQKELEHTNKDNDARVSLLCGMKRRKPRRKKVTENQTNCEIKSKHQICAAIENFVDKMKAKWFDESVNKDRIQTHDSKETAQENLTNFSHSTQTQELGTGTFHSSKKQIVKCDILQINQQENIDEKSYGSKIRSSKQEKEIITEIGGPLKTTKLKWFGKLQNKREINQNITVNNTHPALDDSASVKILEIDVHTDEKMLAANTSNRNENEMCQNELKRIADLFRVVNKQTDSECTVDKKSDSEENIDKKKILAEAQCLIKRDQAKHFSKQKESFIDNPDISHAAVIQKSVDADKLDVKKRVKESNDITLNVKNISPMTPDDEESDTNSSDTELAVSEVNTRPKSRIFGIFKQQYSSEGKANHLQAPKDAFDDTHNIKNLKKKSYDTELGEKEGSPNTPADKESDIDYSDTELAISELNTRPKSRIFGIFKHQNSPDGKTNQQLPPRDVWKAFQEQTDEQNITAEDNKMDIRDIELKENYMKQPKSDIFRMIKGKFLYKEGNKTKISRRCC
ncbi:hypothetical protein DPMN_113392 [Dreissena polymorpha]|uniref:Uncharacterized protein n=1 Tax=Dreissena polymorpha TaxID=45954 RepID=A0A9D4KIK7_DREPO|nr:hypothetical protein DPMN_113392 [Dreissena polymorpha]